jgi:hypothetical protein
MTQRDAWWWALLAVILIGLMLHALFPRYEWRAVSDSGSAIVVYDRWNGRLQRAALDGNRKVKPMDVYTPF